MRISPQSGPRDITIGTPSWAQAKIYMQDAHFMQSLINFPKDTLNDKKINTVNAIRNRLRDKDKEDITPEKVALVALDMAVSFINLCSTPSISGGHFLSH